MIPASINISFDKGKLGGGKTVVVLCRGTGAERCVWGLALSPEQTSGMSDMELVGLALNRFADQLVNGDAEYTTAAENRSLPDHMLRVVNEQAELQERLDKLTAFTQAPGFVKLPHIQQTDLLEQWNAMNELNRVLNKRLARARLARDQ